MKYLTVFLILYFLFTSGFIFEVTKSQSIDKFDIPYSLNFSGYRTGVVGLFSTDDIKAAEWLATHSDKSLKIATDYNGRTLMTGYVLVVPRLSDENYTLPELSDLSYFGNHFYLVKTSWMTRTGRYIEARGIGLRKALPLPSFEDYDLKIVYESGDTLVYEVTKLCK